MARQGAYLRDRFDAGSLGCYNPASRAGGGPSLHAEGRGEDEALNANDPAQRRRGDEMFELLVANHPRFGTQELLWRGWIWSYRNRHLGIRKDGTQQAAHMNHVHNGIDVNAALHWTTDWLTGLVVPSTPSPQAPVEKGAPMGTLVREDPKKGGRQRIWLLTLGRAKWVKTADEVNLIKVHGASGVFDKHPLEIVQLGLALDIDPSQFK